MCSAVGGAGVIVGHLQDQEKEEEHMCRTRWYSSRVLPYYFFEQVQEHMVQQEVQQEVKSRCRSRCAGVGAA